MAVPASARQVRILTQNVIDDDTTFVLSHGGTSANLFDRDKETKYLTSGANRDSTEPTITMTLKVGTTETEMTINQIILLNTNIKEFVLEWWKASTSQWLVVVAGVIPNETLYACYSFGAVLTSRLRLTLIGSQPKFNQEKSIGELIITRVRYILTENPSLHSLQFRSKMQTMEMGDGSRHNIYTRFSTERTNKYGATVSFKYLDQQDYDNLLCLKNEGTAFLWYPESINRPEEIYLVHWVNPFQASYSVSTYVGAGYDITMVLEEV